MAAVKAAQAADHQVVAFSVFGHKADLGLMALGPDWVILRLLQAGHRGRRAGGRPLLRVAHRGVGVRQGHARGDAADPAVPGAAARRESGRSASTPCPSGAARATTGLPLPFEDRKELMLGHGKVGPHLRRPGGAADHRLDRARRLRVGRLAVRQRARRPEGRRLHHALRRGVGPLRRVRPVLHRHRGHRSKRCWPRSGWRRADGVRLGS